MPKPDEDAEPKKKVTKKVNAEPPPKKKTGERPAADAGDPPPKKKSGERPALEGEPPPKKKSGERPAPDLAGEAPPKTKTKRVARPGAAPEGAPAEAPAPAPAEGDAAAPAEGDGPKADADGSREKKGLKKKGAGGLAGKGGKKPGRERAPAAPPPAPAVRGPIDYALGVLAPLIGAGLGAYAFLLISKACARIASNPILGVDPKVIAEPAGLGFAIIFPPAPIIVGALAGLFATFMFLKMAPGLATRAMGAITIVFAILTTLPFVFAGQTLGALVAREVGKTYVIPRGGSIDPRALDLVAPDFEARQFNSLWKIDLDEGEIPIPWLANLKDRPTSPADKCPEEEKPITAFDLRAALDMGRSLQAKKQLDEGTWTKLIALRDKLLTDLPAPSEATQKVEEDWKKFEGAVRGRLSKPPLPKQPWATAFTMQARSGPDSNKPLYAKYYLGKLFKKACPQVPAEVKYVGAFRIEVAEDFVAASEADKTLTKYDFVWLCYDLEKLDREPFLVPHIKGVLSEARFKIEVLGEK